MPSPLLPPEPGRSLWHSVVSVVPEMAIELMSEVAGYPCNAIGLIRFLNEVHDTAMQASDHRTMRVCKSKSLGMIPIDS